MTTRSQDLPPVVEIVTLEIRVASIGLTGRLDALQAVELRSTLDSAVADGICRIVVDLSEVEFVDSAGLAALAKGMKTCRMAGGDLHLVRPDDERANRIFELTRFDRVFEMFDEISAAASQW